MAINNAVNLNSADFTPAGAWSYVGTFGVDTPNIPVVIKNLIVDPLPPPNPGDLRVISENLLFVASASGDASFSAQNGDVSIDAPSGSTNVNGTVQTSVSSAGPLFLSGQTSAQLSASAGDVFVFASGNTSLQATAGNVSIGASAGAFSSTTATFNITGATSGNIDVPTGDLFLSTPAGNMQFVSGSGNITIDAGNGGSSGNVIIISESQGVSITCSSGTFQGNFDTVIFGASGTSDWSSVGAFSLSTGTAFNINCDNYVASATTKYLITSDFFEYRSNALTPLISVIPALAQINADDVQFNANNGFAVTASTMDIVLFAVAGAVTLSAASNLNISSSASVIVSGTSQFIVQTTPSVIIDGTSTVSMDAPVVSVGTVTATGVSIGSAATNVTINGLIYSPDLPGGAPGGSVGVLWDPAGKRFYHV